jgi:hypothetical protein
MSTQTELLKDVVTASGGDASALPDNLLSAHYEAIIKACGGSVDDLPDRLQTTYLKRIAECVSGGGSSGENKLAKLIGGTLEEITEDDLDGVTKIVQYSFYFDKGLKRISVPQSVTAIEQCAFYSCSYIESVNLQNGLKSIGNAAFRSILIISEITIPETVTKIGNQVFQYCDKLENVYMKPTTPPTLGTEVFGNCPALSKIIVPEGCAEAYKAATNWSAYADKIVEEGAA